MATVSDLSVRVSAATSDFNRGMDRAKSALSGLRNDAIQTAGSLQILQGRLDETGDESSQLSRKATVASGTLVGMAGAAVSARLSLSSLTSLISVTLIPAIVALSTVLVPVTAALGGFAFIAASIVGVGLAGFLGAVATRGDRLNNAFSNLTSTVKTEFAPVFRIFRDVLVDLVNALSATIPELVPAEDVVRRIANQFKDLGMAIIDVLPQFVDLAVTTADRFLPPFVDLAQNVLPKLPGFFRKLIPVMLKVWDITKPLADAVIRLAPGLMDVGMTMLNLVIPPFKWAANILGDVVGWFNSLDDRTAKLVGTITMLAPIIGLATYLLGGLSAPVIAAVGAIGLFVHAWRNGWDETKRLIANGVTTITKAINGIGTWLVNNGPRIVNKAIGLFQDIIRDSASWVKQNGPELLQRAFRAVGAGIRFVLKDLYNAVFGRGDSILRSIIVDFGLWLVRKGPGIVMKSLGFVIDAIYSAFKGLYQGLIGNSIIPEMFRDIASYIRHDAASDLARAMKSALGGLGDVGARAFRNAFNSAIPASISVPKKLDLLPGVNFNGSVSLPQLDTGGYIESGGLAQLHAGETVVPAEVDRNGGAGPTINIGTIDARGSENPHQTRRNAERGLADALDAYGVGN